MTTLTALLNTHFTYLLGHRGARGEQLENSKAGFIHTQNLSQKSNGKLVGIEFDVQLTKDGKLVVFHDDSLLRLFSRQSRVDQCTAEQILTIGHPHVLLLQDMPAFLTGYSHIELEIKTHPRTNYQKLVTALQMNLRQSIFENIPLTLTSFDTRLHYFLQTNPFLSQFRRGLLVEPTSLQVRNDLAFNSFQNNSRLHKDTPMSTGVPISQTVLTALQLECQAIGLYYPLFDKPLFNEGIIADCNRYGLSTSAWTVNRIEDAIQLIKLGVNYIITDYPSRFLNH